MNHYNILASPLNCIARNLQKEFAGERMRYYQFPVWINRTNRDNYHSNPKLEMKFANCIMLYVEYWHSQTTIDKILNEDYPLLEESNNFDKIYLYKPYTFVSYNTNTPYFPMWEYLDPDTLPIVQVNRGPINNEFYDNSARNPDDPTHLKFISKFQHNVQDVLMAGAHKMLNSYGTDDRIPEMFRDADGLHAPRLREDTKRILEELKNPDTIWERLLEDNLELVRIIFKKFQLTTNETE